MVIFPSYILTSSKESLFDVILSPGVPVECIDNDPVNVWFDPDTINEPVIFVSALISNPLLGDIDAVADPLAIWDKFNPTIPDAGISVNPLPLPS